MIDRDSHKKSHPPKEYRSNQSNQHSKAPYNFVPLNESVIKAEPLPSFNTYHFDNRYTGYIELEIEAVTPLYIRDTLNDKELNDKLKHEEKLKQGKKLPPYANPDFFSPGNLIRIPGSSLRGMIRTLVEIVSFGKFVNFDDRRLYFRSFADQCKNFRDSYRKHVKPKAGILIKQGLNYFIIPTNCVKIFKEEAKTLIYQSGEKYTDFRIYEVSLNKKNYYLVVSGHMGGQTEKKRDYLVERPSQYGEKIQLSQEDIEDYRNDKERRAKIDLLEFVQKRGEVPCFYSIYHDNQNRQRVAFGHTLMFRIPYVKSIGDHVPESLTEVDYFDIAEAIFGKETSHASRVFFEDCFLVETENPYRETANPKILSSPKPTCFQHYLIQNEEILKNHPNNLAHYNDSNPIRGYKLYWHKALNEENDKENWKANAGDVSRHPTQYTKITPIKEGTKFRGKIRFENLSEVELGALMFVLALPPGCNHKLGMGKPLGLGSVKIKPILYISDRKQRYSNLFSEWTEKPEQKSFDKFTKDFQAYVQKHIGDNLNDLWEHRRLTKLRLMLDYEKKPKKEMTSYLDVKDFRQRRVLPEPEEVLKEN